jgi:hypothetical protein
VSAEIDGDGEWSTPGLDFCDYARMNTQQRKQSGERRLPTPEWANDWSKLRSLVVRAWELRAGFNYPRPGTEKERLAVAQAHLMKDRPAKIALLERLCSEFVGTMDPSRRHRLEICIKALDGQIVISDRGPGVLAAMVHQYYGFCADSVGTANELGGISPQSVRQHLYRLHRVWDRMPREEVRELVMYRTRCHTCGSDQFTTPNCADCGNMRHYRRQRERRLKVVASEDQVANRAIRAALGKCVLGCIACSYAEC